MIELERPEWHPQGARHPDRLQGNGKLPMQSQRDPAPVYEDSTNVLRTVNMGELTGVSIKLRR